MKNILRKLTVWHFFSLITILLILIVSIANPFLFHGQSFASGATYGATHVFGSSSDEDTGTSIRSDTSGNIYATGTYTGSVDFNTTADAVGAAVLGNVSSSSAAASSSLAWSHTVDAGSNRLLVVEVSTSDAHAIVVSDITYGEDHLHFKGSVDPAGGNPHSEIWYLVAPTVGTDDITITYTGSTYSEAGALDFTGVDQSTPLGNYASNSGLAATSGSVTVSGAVGDIIVDNLTEWDSDGDATAAGGQTQQWHTSADGAWKGYGSTKAGAASVTTSWNFANTNDWALSGVAVKGLISGGTGIDVQNAGVATLRNISTCQGSTPCAWSHTIDPGPDRLLVVEVSFTDQTLPVTSVTYGAAPLTLYGAISAGSGNFPRSEIWYIKNPDVGTDTITVDAAGNGNQLQIGALDFTGVDQTTPLGTYASNSGLGAHASDVTVSGSEGSLVIDNLTEWDPDGDAVANLGQTQLWERSDGAWKGYGSISRIPAGGSSVDMAWTLHNINDWALSGVAINGDASSDVYLTKTNTDGTYGWTKTLASPSNLNIKKVTTDTDVNVYIAGVFANTVDFDPSTAQDFRTAPGTGSSFVSKYDSDGNYIWTNITDGAGYAETDGMVVDGNSWVYVTGLFQGTVDSDPSGGVDNHTASAGTDIFISQYDTDGNYIWTYTLGSSGTDTGNAVGVDGSGNIYVTGTYAGTVNFDPTGGTDNHTAVDNRDIFTSKYDTNGNYLWTNTVGGDSVNLSGGIAVDNAGEVYVAGDFFGTVDFDPSAGTDNQAGPGDPTIENFFISKYDTDGTYVWTKVVGSTLDDSFAHDIAIDGSGNNIYIAGEFYATTDFDPGVGVENRSPGTSTDDAFALSLDSDGAFNWVQVFNTDNFSFADSITVNNIDNSVWFTGEASGSSDFDPDAGHDNQTVDVNGDAFITRMDAELAPTPTPTDTPVPTDTPIPTDTPTDTDTPTPTSTPVPPTDTPTPTPTGTLVPTNTPTLTPTPSNTPIPPTNTPTSTPTNTPTPSHTPTPTRTPTAVPTHTVGPTHTAVPTTVPTHTTAPTIIATNTPFVIPTTIPTDTPILTSGNGLPQTGSNNSATGDLLGQFLANNPQAGMIILLLLGGSALAAAGIGFWQLFAAKRKHKETQPPY